MLRSLPILGSKIGDLLFKLVSVNGFDDNALEIQKQIIDEICNLLHIELKKQNITSSEDWFFTTHGEEAMKRIQHNVIRGLPATYE